MIKTLTFGPLAILSAPRAKDGAIRLAYLPPHTTILNIRLGFVTTEIDVELPDDGEAQCELI